MRIGEIGEFGLIQRVSQQFASHCDGCIDGIGDDCAVLEMPGCKDLLLVTTDLLVESIHFIRDQIPPRTLGRKSLSVNLSDIAAMGGVPWAFFLSIALPESIDLEFIDAFMMGIHDRSRQFNVALLGGDTTRADAHLTINITVLGKSPHHRVKRRSGAQPGDIIQVSGQLGSSAAGLHLLLNDQLGEDTGKFIAAHLDPEPRLAVGLALSEIPGVTSMIDVSDGLLQDLSHICERSLSGARVDFDAIPHHPDLLNCARQDDRMMKQWVVSGGEDYELVWTVSPTDELRALNSVRDAGARNAASIGVITDTGRVELFDGNGAMEIPNIGWDHFRNA